MYFDASVTTSAPVTPPAPLLLGTGTPGAATDELGVTPSVPTVAPVDRGSLPSVALAAATADDRLWAKSVPEVGAAPGAASLASAAWSSAMRPVTPVTVTTPAR